MPNDKIINFEALDDLDFNTLDNKDKEKNHIKKMKGRPVIKGTNQEKSFKKQLAWTPEEKKDLEKYQDILKENTLANTIYKLIEYGKEKAKEDLLKKL